MARNKAQHNRGVAPVVDSFRHVVELSEEEAGNMDMDEGRQNETGGETTRQDGDDDEEVTFTDPGETEGPDGGVTEDPNGSGTADPNGGEPPSKNDVNVGPSDCKNCKGNFGDIKINLRRNNAMPYNLSPSWRKLTASEWLNTNNKQQ